MSRFHCRLTRTKVAALRRAAKDGLHADGGGLYLVVANGGAAASWIFRWAKIGTERRMGLGSVDSVSLATARNLAAAARADVAAGVDPITKRTKERDKRKTFDEYADAYITTMAVGLSAKQALAWRNSLKRYASPVLGRMLLADIDIAAVLRVLQRNDFWRKKTKTADTVRARIERIIGTAINAGIRPGPNPAVWKDCLDGQLPPPSALTRVQHLEALPYDKLPALMRTLRARDDIAAVALRFNLLTATRTADIQGAEWSAIDLENKTWTIARTKNGDQLIVPLSRQALALLRTLRDKQVDSEIVFARASGQHIGHQAMLRLLQEKLGYRDATVHGSVRSCFKTLHEERGKRTRVIEACLSHRVAKDDTEGAYLRTTFFKQRRSLMQQWAHYLDAKPAVPRQARRVSRRTPAAAGDGKITALASVNSGRRSA